MINFHLEFLDFDLQGNPPWEFRLKYARWGQEHGHYFKEVQEEHYKIASAVRGNRDKFNNLPSNVTNNILNHMSTRYLDNK